MFYAVFKLTFRALPCVLNVLRVNGLIGRVKEVALVHDNVMIVHPKVQPSQQVVGTPAIAYNASTWENPAPDNRLQCLTTSIMALLSSSSVHSQAQWHQNPSALPSIDPDDISGGNILIRPFQRRSAQSSSTAPPPPPPPPPPPAPEDICCSQTSRMKVHQSTTVCLLYVASQAISFCGVSGPEIQKNHQLG